MGSSRTRTLVLAAMLVVLAVVIYRAWRNPATGALPSSNLASVRGPVDREEVAGPPDVRLERLEARRPEPADASRNLFRFGSRQSPSARPPDTRPGALAPPISVPAPPVGSTPSIALKFIGIVEAPNRSLRLAILSDERGVYHGREGDIIEGRYRIVGIGIESVEMSRLDGSGRQTIRLSGS